MPAAPPLRHLDLLVLLALLRIGDEAYGLPVARAIERASGRGVALASVYASLARLEQTALLTSRWGEPTPERGGRAKKHFRITAAGLRAVRSSRRTLTTLWDGLPQLEGGRA